MISVTRTMELIAVPGEAQGRYIWMQEESAAIGKTDLERLSGRVSGRTGSFRRFSRTDGCVRQSDLVRKKVGAE